MQNYYLNQPNNVGKTLQCIEYKIYYLYFSKMGGGVKFIKAIFQSFPVLPSELFQTARPLQVQLHANAGVVRLYAFNSNEHDLRDLRIAEVVSHVQQCLPLLRGEGAKLE